MGVLWQNPWAWLGLTSIALPILIHLLGRGHAKVQRFPTLRFLSASRLLPTRRTRIHDGVLLGARIGILLFAVAALAQPLLKTNARTRQLDAVLARAIIMDTSASMSRSRVAARDIVTRMTTGAQAAEVIETTDPDRAIPAAVAWLGRQPGRREITIVSDFQIGTLDSVSVAGVPASIGLRFARVGGIDAGPRETVSQLGGSRVTARIEAGAEQTSVEWSSNGVSQPGPDIQLLTVESERLRARAALVAAGIAGIRLPLDSSLASRVAIVTPEMERDQHYLTSAVAPTTAWMVDLVTRLRRDSALQQSAEREATIGSDSLNGLAAVRNAAGRTVVTAAVSPSDTARLILVSAAGAGNLTTAMLVASTRKALSRAHPLSELEPLSLAESVLASWQREPASAIDNENSVNGTDARWLWAGGLVLLIVEIWLRRIRRRVVATSEEARARAA